MNKVFTWIRKETRRVLPAVIYFFVAFNLFRLTFGQMFAHLGLQPARFGATIIAAIIVGKVMVIVDNIPFFNLFSDKPRIYNAAWRVSIYFFVSLLIRVIDHLTPYLIKLKHIGVAVDRLLADMWWAKFWTIQVWYFILLGLFVFFQELVKALGKDKLREIFFDPTASKEVL